MRDDHVSPPNGDTAGREKTTRGRRAKRSGTVAGAEPPTARAPDAPAPLTASSTPADVDEAGLSDEEITLYRRRIAEGLYNTREVADEVARRMMRRGDV